MGDQRDEQNGTNTRTNSRPSVIGSDDELSENALDQVVGGISNIMKSTSDTASSVVQNQK